MNLSNQHIIKLCLCLCLSISLCSVAKDNVKNTSKTNQSHQSSQTENKKFELSDQDKKFIELREAARKNDLLKASQLASGLGNYEIADYVEYFKIKPRLYDSAAKPNASTDADSEVNNFLKKYKGSALADRLRNDWLLVLGKRKDWLNFDQEYPQFMLDDDTQVKCYAMMSKLSKGDLPKTVGAQARATLLDPRYFGDACPELVAQLYARGGLSKQEALSISRSATEMNFDTQGQKMGVEDPIVAIVRKARTNPSLAMQTFNENDWRNNSEYKAMAWGVIGQFLAKKLDPTAIDAYRKQHALGQSELLSAESSEWKVRAALREKDWKLVKESVEAMPEAIRLRDPAWTYWHGRALKELGDDRANEEFEKLAGQFHFYAQLSLEELGRPITIPPKTVVTDADMKSISKSIPAFTKAAKLYDMNLRTEGNREWNWELRGMSDRELLASAEYGKKINMLDRTVNTADRTKVEHNFSLRFPTPYVEKLQPITKQIHLDINWVYGLIRQESRFVIAARSSVGASGLMQVMPATGQFVAKKIGMTDYTPDKLADLQTNLVLGSNYLNMVLNDLDGSWGMASAAYNAGPGRPKQWRQTLTKQVSMEAFAETIPFTETRTYVKNVLSNAVYYEILSTGKPQSIKAKLGTVNPSQAVSSNLP
ncbi:MAG: transglycosylase SLT domain-containing protein [Betaproteobacteria bacterium]